MEGISERLEDALRRLAVEAADLLEELLASGAELPFDLEPTPGDGPLPMYQYSPLTGEFIARHIAELRRLEAFVEVRELAGEETAKHSEPIAIENGVLQVRCESTAWATQLRLMRTELVTRILDRYPGAGVETIRFQGPDAPTWKRGPRSVPGRGPRDTYG